MKFNVSDKEADMSELASHPGWKTLWPLLVDAIDDMKERAILDEERHLYHKGYLQGAQYIVEFIQLQLNRHKD